MEYKGIKILGTGSSVPSFTIDNNAFTEIVETSDEWISERTGIKTRHFVKDETLYELAVDACEKAIAEAGIDKNNIGFVISATCTADYRTPSLSCMLQAGLELSQSVFAIDINAACSGFLYSINTAYSLLHSAPEKYALVIGGEILSRVTDFSDRGTCVLFGDGAGAVVVSLSKENDFAFDYAAMGNTEVLNIPAEFRSVNPFTETAFNKNEQYLRMDGTEVYRFAVESFPKSANAVFEKIGITANDIDHYVCHQANLRIIMASAKKLRVPLEKFFVNIEKYGNTSAASVAIALDELNKSGRLKRGDKLILAGFGGGLTYGTAYMVW